MQPGPSGSGELTHAQLPTDVTLNSERWIWEGVVTYADHGKGDSGGPTWHWDNGDAYLVSNTGYYYGYHTNYSPCGNEAGQDSAGVAAYQINSYGYTMGR